MTEDPETARRALFGQPGVGFERPDHPDFWTLSRIVTSLDEAMDYRDPDKDPDEIIGEKATEVGDPASLTYVAVQRAMRVHGIVTAGDLKRVAEDVSRTATAYLEGMIVGARFVAEGQ